MTRSDVIENDTIITEVRSLYDLITIISSLILTPFTLLNPLRIVGKIIRWVVDFFLHLFSLVIGIASLVNGMFRLYPTFVGAKLVQIFLPYSIFGRFFWWFYFRVYDAFKKYHVLIMGNTGCGKSFFMLHLIYRDIIRKQGALLIEPHSTLVQWVLHLRVLQLDYKSKHYERIIYLDFEHTESPPGFNLFAVPLPEGKDEKEVFICALTQSYILALDGILDNGKPLPPGTRRLLSSVLHALFYLPGATLLDALQILQPLKSLPVKYIRLFNTIENPVLKQYFATDFHSASINATSKQALALRLEQLLSNKIFLKSLTKPTFDLNIPKALREGHIVLVRAGETLGSETSVFIGSIIHRMTLFYGFHRIKERYKKRFTLYLDEMQNYLGSKNSDISRGLDEARKAAFSYVLAHQRSRQQGLTRDKQRALNSAGVKIIGTISDYHDAQWMSRQLLIKRPERLMRLRVGEFFIRIGWFTKFVKFPRYFAPNPSKLGLINHRLFAKTKQVNELIKYLRKKQTQTKKINQNNINKPNKSFNFSLNHEKQQSYSRNQSDKQIHFQPYTQS